MKCGDRQRIGLTESRNFTICAAEAALECLSKSLGCPIRAATDAIIAHKFLWQASMKLIGSLSSPYVRKVRVAMAEKKLDYEFVLENVWHADTKIQESNPLAKVPCLVMEDGGAMFDSRVIVEYLDTLSPVGKLIPTQGRERAGVKCWEALADGVLDAGILIRLEKTLRPPEKQSQEWVDRQLKKVHAGLKAMSVGFADTPFCTGNQYTLADVAVGCALGWLSFRFPEINWKETHPNLVPLYEKLSERPSFKDTVPQ
jgi:glutathione S-transferase